jgi:hypothetical protein
MGQSCHERAGPIGHPSSHDRADVRKSLRPMGISEDHRMDKKAKNPKKPKQTKTKDGTSKAK